MSQTDKMSSPVEEVNGYLDEVADALEAMSQAGKVMGEEYARASETVCDHALEMHTALRAAMEEVSRLQVLAEDAEQASREHLDPQRRNRAEVQASATRFCLERLTRRINDARNTED